MLSDVECSSHTRRSMYQTSIFLLLGAAGVVAILHSILPDHWVPLAVVARTQRWSLFHVGRVTFLASLGHVIASLILGGIIALVGLQFQKEIDTQQGHIVGGMLVITGLAFLIWSRLGKGPHSHSEGGHSHDHGLFMKHKEPEHDHEPEHEHEHDHEHEHEHGEHSHAVAA